MTLKAATAAHSLVTRTRFHSRSHLHGSQLLHRGGFNNTCASNFGVPKQHRFYSRTTSVSKPMSLRSGQKGASAFADCEQDAISDLFYHHATKNGDGIAHLDLDGLKALLHGIGEKCCDSTTTRLFKAADLNQDGMIEIGEFLVCANDILGGSPARIVLVVGGPGSGKGLLCERLEQECNVVHLSSGNLLRDEVRRGTPLGKEVAQIMQRGGLVSSAIIVTLIRRRMRDHPGKRVLLDGFPRSLENAHDLMEICGKPELALHLSCDDTILMERILRRGKEGTRPDDNVETALTRLRTYHKYHPTQMEWLREQGVPVVNLDCSGSPDSVWHQLLAIGRLMRPAAKYSRSKDEAFSIFDDEDVPEERPMIM